VNGLSTPQLGEALINALGKLKPRINVFLAPPEAASGGAGRPPGGGGVRVVGSALRHAVRQSWRLCGGGCSGVLFLEAGMLLGIDSLHLYTGSIPFIERDDDVIGITLHHTNGHLTDETPLEGSALARSEYMSGLAWGTTKAKIDRILRDMPDDLSLPAGAMPPAMLTPGAPPALETASTPSSGFGWLDWIRNGGLHGRSFLRPQVSRVSIPMWMLEEPARSIGIGRGSVVPLYTRVYRGPGVDWSISGIPPGMRQEAYDKAFFARIRQTPYAGGNTPLSTLQGDARYTYTNLDQWLTVAKQGAIVPIWHGGVPADGYKGAVVVRNHASGKGAILLHPASIEDVYAFWRRAETEK